jgi:histidine kinase
MHSSPMDIKREESPTPRDVLIKTSFVDSKASDLKTTDPALKSKLFQVLDPSQDSSNDFDASDASEDSSESGQPSLPEDKLYGREKEQASLSDTFQRITQLKTPKKLEFVLISGPSGTGKSKLAQSLQERVQAEGGYFCSGKFDQLNQAHPMSPLVAAFNDYVQQIIAEGEESIKRVRAALLREVGSDLWIVAQVMPAIADLVGKENVVDDQCCTGAMVAAKRGACAIHAIKKMMRAISSPERPLVLMLDDLQWATQTPLRKLRAMVTDPLNDGVLFVATCRDDVASNSELSSFLRELEDDEVQITNIALSNLSYPVIAELVEDKLGLPAAKSTAMSEFLFKRSDGNIFFVFEILRWLRDTKVLTCDKKTMLWSMGAMPTCQFCHHSGFLDRKMGMLPRDVQKVLMVASCLGANITQELMETALQENIEDPLALLVRKRLLVVDDNQETYSFPHDRIQSAAYSLIGVELKPAFHLEIGRRLWKNLGDKQLDCNLFVVLTQLEKGAHIIRDRAMLHEIADLCIRAAEQSVALSSFHIASERLNFAMTLLGENCWDEAYDLSLVLYNHAAEVEVSIGNHDRVEALLKQVLDNAKSFSDQLRAYSTQVYVLGVQGKMNLAIKTGLHVLDQLGEGQPAKFSKTGLYWNMSIICRKLKRKTNRSIRRLPHMTDPKKIAAMQILNMLFLNTFLARPDMFPFVVVKMMKLTLADGLSAISAVAFAGFGMLMAFSGKITQGLKCGQISLDILDDFEARSFLPRCYAFVYGFIRAHAMPWTDTLEPLKLGHSVGLSTGDLEFATVNAQFHILFLVDIGQVPLPAIARRLLELRDANEMHGHRVRL